MAQMKFSTVKAEVKQKARELFAKTYNEMQCDLAATYAAIEAQNRELNMTAETPAKVKKAMIYDEATRLTERHMLNSFMESAGYKYNLDVAGWKKGEAT